MGLRSGGDVEALLVVFLSGAHPTTTTTTFSDNGIALVHWTRQSCALASFFLHLCIVVNLFVHLSAWSRR